MIEIVRGAAVLGLAVAGVGSLALVLETAVEWSLLRRRDRVVGSLVCLVYAIVACYLVGSSVNQ